MDVMTDIIREKFASLMGILNIPLRQWYILLDSLLALHEDMSILPNGNIELL